MEQLFADALKGMIAAGPCTALLFWLFVDQRKELKAVRKEKDKLLVHVLKLANHVSNLPNNDPDEVEEKENES